MCPCFNAFPKSFALVDPSCSPLRPLNTRVRRFRSSLFPSFPPSGSFFEFGRFAAAMFFFDDEAVQFPFPCPVLETMLTAGEIQEWLSLIDQSGDPTSPNSGSQESNRSVYSTDEIKRRRMLSNRESARRSRWRKKQHLENLTNKAKRLKIENQELKTRLGMIMHHHLLVSGQNEQLRSESISLLTRLSDLYRILGTMHSQ